VPAPIPLRRVAVIAAVLFVLILAFLAGRVHAGTDPAQVATAAQRAPAAPPAPQETGPGEDDPYGDDYGDGDDFPGGPPQGTVPDQNTAPSPGGQDLDPPVTQAS